MGVNQSSVKRGMLPQLNQNFEKLTQKIAVPWAFKPENAKWYNWVSILKIETKDKIKLYNSLTNKMGGMLTLISEFCLLAKLELHWTQFQFQELVFIALHEQLIHHHTLPFLLSFRHHIELNIQYILLIISKMIIILHKLFYLFHIILVLIKIYLMFKLQMNNI